MAWVWMDVKDAENWICPPLWNLCLYDITKNNAKCLDVYNVPGSLHLILFICCPIRLTIYEILNYKYNANALNGLAFIFLFIPS
uniref:Uncharacterized protein n=1 Tax=Anguilla anguilla TaxID=7936 RepID=A0A0E9W9L1_ANGAN